jgi:hypothetical protein
MILPSTTTMRIDADSAGILPDDTRFTMDGYSRTERERTAIGQDKVPAGVAAENYLTATAQGLSAHELQQAISSRRTAE